MDEKISICIPAYNNETVIGPTIEAILCQSYKNFELIIVDDASTDDTVKVINNYQDERIRLYRNEKNLGMVGNWNRCVELTTSEFIKLVCADDILLPRCLETELKAIKESDDIVMTASDSIMVNQNKKKLGIFRRYPKKGLIEGRKLAKKSLIFNNFFGMPCAVMFRKSFFERVNGFDERFHYILDFDLWLSMAPLGRVQILNEKLNCFMLRPDSNTGKVLCTEHEAYYKEHVALLCKHANSLSLGTISIACSKFCRKVRTMAYGIWLRWALQR